MDNQDNIYSTSDKTVCFALDMLFELVDTATDERDKMVYNFRKNDKRSVPVLVDDTTCKFEVLSVMDIVTMIRNGQANKIMFSFGDYWTSEGTWLTNLRHFHNERAYHRK